MHKGTFIAGLLAALFGGILIGLLLAPFKNGVNFNNSKFNIGNHSGNGNAPSLSIFSPQSTVRKNSPKIKSAPVHETGKEKV